MGNQDLAPPVLADTDQVGIVVSARALSMALAYPAWAPLIMEAMEAAGLSIVDGTQVLGGQWGRAIFPPLRYGTGGAYAEGHRIVSEVQHWAATYQPEPLCGLVESVLANVGLIEHIRRRAAV